MDPAIFSLTEVLKNYGLSAALSIAFVMILVFVLKWVFKMAEAIQTQSERQRDVFIKSLGDLTTRMDEYAQRSQAFCEQVVEAHGYQRQEHIEMLKGLQEVTYNAKAVREGFDQTNAALRETTAGLARVNGYKKSDGEAQK